jgi:phytoene dehydrogenase-like protein
MDQERMRPTGRFIDHKKTDAIVIGSGPNGLAAGITLARAGRSVTVYEAEKTIGGGARSACLTLPGFIHDVCSSVHPLAVASSFTQSLPLKDLGVSWVYPEAALAHPFDDGTAIIISHSLDETAARFGPDQQAVRELFTPFVNSWQHLSSDILRPARLPRHPWNLARFGWNAITSAAGMAKRKFQTDKARAVFAGMAAHSVMSLDSPGSSAFGIVLWTMCHTVGWPFALGGSQAISNGLAEYLQKLGGEIVTDARVASLDDLPETSAVLCDLTPLQFFKIAGRRLSKSNQRRFKNYAYGPGVFKIDWSLDAPIPWNAPECRKAGTVHLGGSLQEIIESERSAWSKSPSERPFVLVTQPSLFDTTRAPSGKHTAWGYCHVPHGSDEDVVERIESQVERFASGFRKHILHRALMSPKNLEEHNANLIGGDISGGAMHLRRLIFESTRLAYSTGIERVFLCSSSTPPGPGVHGLCGYYAAQLANEKCFRSARGTTSTIVRS